MSGELGRAEQWRAALETVIRRYRAGLVAKTETTLTLDEALAELHKLDLSTGDAMRYLVPRGKK